MVIFPAGTRQVRRIVDEPPVRESGQCRQSPCLDAQLPVTLRATGRLLGMSRAPFDPRRADQLDDLTGSEVGDQQAGVRTGMEITQRVEKIVTRIIGNA